MTTFIRTPEFDVWLKALRDPIGKARIISRIRSAEQGYWGDCEPVGNGVFEMKIHCGPGYRVYYSRKGDVTYLLLCGGNKTNQSKDIKQAKRLHARQED
ncbi:MAG TPA: type II toxin-antitoxin system RelE/ParE family toxin [Pseudomonadales bacterium]|jgi:putative addiction module killer protein|nr:type II toxin-antitoxin system RelE/ParE family toxin [Pseudomonadales bacterium]HNI37407.1 type II toxin-antitoxin system RelE/ParE family toxin [Pseudomonadales bacterium]HNL92495.1 type II toxin-antitoxin system RelE/ParE family toxin [Pseudomonadales bacterium]HNN86839.1 type II toxin-antitoxin system RelE/ParE family toxin [Pseudomonadales bacterium]